jgi:hypothetical protein
MVPMKQLKISNLVQKYTTTCIKKYWVKKSCT